ncbi:hypothetical protein SAMN05421819_2142 [Bryocella elongata]|uniref:Uncharacterized protein n=1 Tax=Bryocella elongata TaxID=863522 RepID=A0A1H5Y627_9BACT|nr:hypothetical protein [Bryocella elongata]SEG19444.1 hypothetical protein SAMN05421819_2142 [Bryocella elongata]
MQETLENEFEEILGAFVVAAKKGSSAHMKLATELLERAAKPGKRNAGSALRLLRELEGEDVTG